MPSVDPKLTFEKSPAAGAATAQMPQRLAAVCLQSSVKRAAFRLAMKDVHVYDHTLTIDEKLSVFTNDVRHACLAFCDGSTQPKKAWLSATTWESIQSAHALKKSMRRARLWTQLCRLRQVFAHWLACCPPTFLRHHTYISLCRISMITNMWFKQYAVYSLYFVQAASSARRLAKLDKQAHLHSACLRADRSARAGDVRPIFQVAKHLSA